MVHAGLTSLLASGVLFLYWFTLVPVVLMFALLGKPNMELLLYFVHMLKLATAVMGEYMPGFRTPEFYYATMTGIAAGHPGTLAMRLRAYCKPWAVICYWIAL